MKEKEYPIEWLYIPIGIVVLFILLFLTITLILVKKQDCNNKTPQDYFNDQVCVSLRNF